MKIGNQLAVIDVLGRFGKMFWEDVLGNEVVVGVGVVEAVTALATSAAPSGGLTFTKIFIIISRIEYLFF